ncbi:hypothetical protein [Candidatus Albibeggiatoa sp. nov. BB20]|uniref:hypothetical protein n=1 Tax=Candidatus Albibeggiatoa sp. nov. BB20 TaxID=3162723 RepID=UPI00336540CF
MSDIRGKKILIAEDRIETVQYLIDALKAEDAVVKYVQNLTDAYTHLNKNQVDLALIDLNIPPIPDELKEYVQKLKIRGNTLNQGQTLGVWLDEKKPNIKYAYLTAFPIALDTRTVKSQKNITILDKFSDDLAYDIKGLLSSK